MKIKSIEFINNKVLGDLFLDFTDGNGNAVDTILLAGENGSGKSQILNSIYELSAFNLKLQATSDEKCKLTIHLSDSDVDTLSPLLKPHIPGLPRISNQLTIFYDYSYGSDWRQISLTFKTDSTDHILSGVAIGNNQIAKNIFRAIFSDVAINFLSKQISSVTTKDIEQVKTGSVKSTVGLAGEITQLLVDVQALDDAEIAKWVRKNPQKPTDLSQLNLRMPRFEEAFAFMFPTKRYKEIKNENGKQVIFEEHGKEISANDLSSGEKQIIFRGSFLLKDKKSNKGAIALIDEPEISLHPKWQLKILQFYKKLFTDENGAQTSQMLIATHSPFIIHNESRTADKVIVIRRDDKGKTYVSKTSDFYGWTSEEKVLEAFGINWEEQKSPIVLTEGKSDASILQAAWMKLNPNKILPWNIISVGTQIKEEGRSGGADVLKRTLELSANVCGSQKVIGLFDNDSEGNKRFNGLDKTTFDTIKDDGIKKHKSKEIYAILLPAPESRKKFIGKDIDLKCLEIEHLFSDEILKEYNMNDEGILGTEVFKIKGDKIRFSETVKNLDVEAFANFQILFTKIDKLFASQS